MAIKVLFLCCLTIMFGMKLIVADKAYGTQYENKANSFQFPLPFNSFSFFSQFIPLGNSRQTRDVTDPQPDEHSASPFQLPYPIDSSILSQFLTFGNSRQTREVSSDEQNDKANHFQFPFDPFTFFSQFIPLGNSRKTRDVTSQENIDTEDQSNEAVNNRFFFSLGRAVVTCNYTATPGLSCVGCYQALSCGPNNVGVQRRCSLYCNTGRCSLVPGSQCLNSTAAG